MKMWVRIGFLIASLVIAILCIVFDCPQCIDMIGALSVISSSIVCAWKNNDFTKAAKVGTKIMEAIKDGKITAEEMQDILNEVGYVDKS